MLSRQEGSTTRHLASVQHWTGLAGGDTGRLFLTFGGPVCADRISYCPLDRVLTYKNLIYLLNLQFYQQDLGHSACTYTVRMCTSTEDSFVYTFLHYCFYFCVVLYLFNIFRKVLDILHAQEQGRDLHEHFHQQLHRAKDGFSVIADYFGRGVFNKVRHC